MNQSNKEAMEHLRSRLCEKKAGFKREPCSHAGSWPIKPDVEWCCRCGAFRFTAKGKYPRTVWCHPSKTSPTDIYQDFFNRSFLLWRKLLKPKTKKQ